MGKMFFTLVGCKYYFGTDFLKPGMKLKLVKEKDNEYDSEAILVKMKGIGAIGHVANSTYTVKGDTMSAGRLYDKIGKKAKAKVVYVIPGGAVCKIIEKKQKVCVADGDWLSMNHEEIMEAAGKLQESEE